MEVEVEVVAQLGAVKPPPTRAQNLGRRQNRRSRRQTRLRYAAPAALIACFASCPDRYNCYNGWGMQRLLH